MSYESELSGCNFFFLSNGEDGRKTGVKGAWQNGNDDMMNHGSSKPDWGSFLRGVVGQNFLLAFSFLSYMECINIFYYSIPLRKF